MATNVKVKIFLNPRVAVQNSTSGPKDGAQWHNQHPCWTYCSLGDWIWRFETAKQILCAGITNNGLYYGQVVGDAYV